MLYLIKSQALAGRGVLCAAGDDRGLRLFLLYRMGMDGESCLEPSSRKSGENQYASNRCIYRNAEIWPRLGYWITASFATLASALAWQLHWGRRLHDP